MTKQQLVEDVQSFLTSSYGIPLRIPPKEIERKIQDAERWFYQYYDRAVEQRLWLVPHDYFDSYDFKEIKPSETYLVEITNHFVTLKIKKSSNSLSGTYKLVLANSLGSDDCEIKILIAGKILLTNIFI